MVNNLEALRKSTLFQGFEDEVLQRFLKSAKSETRVKDDVIYVEQSEHDGIYFILDGTVRAEMELEEPAHHADIGAGEIFGLETFVQEGTPVVSITTKAKTDVSLLVWRASQWRQICEQDTRTGYVLARRIGRILFERIRAWSISIMNNVAWGIE